MKTFIKKKLNDKGLTLVELLAVIVILGIIAAIAIPAIGNIIENSRIKAVKADAQNVLAAANMYFAEESVDGAASGGGTAGEIKGSELKDKGYLDDAGTAGDLTVKYNKNGNTITGSASNKNITIKFTDATNASISASGKELEVTGDTSTPTP